MDTKVLKTRIKSVDSTLHLTKAMGLVASSKIRRANDAMLKSKQYAAAYDDCLSLLCRSKECRKSPYMRASGEKAALIVIAGDRGMAGGYNANVFRLCREYEAVKIFAIGKRAVDRFGGESLSSESYAPAQALALAQELCEGFVAGTYDKIGIISTQYESIMTQKAVYTQLLPLQIAEGDAGRSVIFEPDELTILNTVVPEYLAGKIMACIRESFASEVAARRMAMDAAGKNAQAMIDDLQLEYNRARQGAITQEITEIISGSGN